MQISSRVRVHAWTRSGHGREAGKMGKWEGWGGTFFHPIPATQTRRGHGTRESQTPNLFFELFVAFDINF
jgi:hypothetical protein